MRTKEVIVLGLCTLGMLFGLSKCTYEKDYKAYGVIKEVNKNEVKVDTLVPSPLRKEVRECIISNTSESKVECKEQVKELTYTHSINTQDIKDRDKENIHIGQVLPLKLPVLSRKEVSINKQYVKLTPYEIQVGTQVFLDGVMKGNEVRVKGLFKSDTSPLTITSQSTGIVLVFIPSKYSLDEPDSFYIYKEEGQKVSIYEIMTPNIQRDEVGSSSILNDESWMNVDKVMSISSDFTTVYGIEEAINIRDYINTSSTPIPLYKNKSSIPIPSPSIVRSESRRHQSLSFKQLIGWVIIILIGIYLIPNWDSISTFIRI